LRGIAAVLDARGVRAAHGGKWLVDASVQRGPRRVDVSEYSLGLPEESRSGARQPRAPSRTMEQLDFEVGFKPME